MKKNKKIIKNKQKITPKPDCFDGEFKIKNKQFEPHLKLGDEVGVVGNYNSDYLEIFEVVAIKSTYFSSIFKYDLKNGNKILKGVLDLDILKKDKIFDSSERAEYINDYIKKIEMVSKANFQAIKKLYLLCAGLGFTLVALSIVLFLK